MSWQTLQQQRRSSRRSSIVSTTSVNLFRTSTLVLEATKALSASGFKGYNTPEKLSKVKSHLRNANDVCFLPDDDYVVSDKKDGSIHIFGREGDHKKLLVNSGRPCGVDANGCGTIAFVDRKDKTIRVVASENGSVFSKWGEDMDWDPYAIAWNNKGRLLISDTSKNNHQVAVYTVDGRCMREFGSSGRGNDQFDCPWYLAVDPYDRIAISDRCNHCIKMFDDSGHFMKRIGGYGINDGQLRYPRGLCTDSKGNLIVCDTGNKRVSVFGPDGRFMQHLLEKEDGLAHPFAVDLSRKTGRLLVSQHDADTAVSFRKVRVYQIQKL